MITLKQSDLDELRSSNNFLSDVIMEFYFNYLSSYLYPSDSILFISPTVCFMLANSDDEEDVEECLKPLQFSTKDLILFPVNNGGTHWSLMVYYRAVNCFIHHDSLKGLNDDNARVLYSRVRQFVNQRYVRSPSHNRRRRVETDVPNFGVVASPQQTNGYDCGLYVMAIAEVVCEWFIDEDEWNSMERQGLEVWFDYVQRKVDVGLEFTMRAHVLRLIEKASVGELGTVSCTIEEKRELILPAADSGGNCGVEGEGGNDCGKLVGPLPLTEARAYNNCRTTESQASIATPTNRRRKIIGPLPLAESHAYNDCGTTVPVSDGAGECCSAVEEKISGNECGTVVSVLKEKLD